MKFVFDLGNVIVYFKPTEYLKGLGYDGEKLAALRRAIFESQAWLKMDAGEITREQETDEIVRGNPELEADIRAIMARCDEMLQPIPESVRTLTWLAQRGFECYYLSNTNAPALEYMQSFDYWKYFKGGVASYAELICKPDPAIYELFANRYGLSPQECVFIDDNPQNVLAARGCGYNAYTLLDADGLFQLVSGLVAEYDKAGQKCVD